MTKEDIDKLLPYFRLYSDSSYKDWGMEPQSAKWYFHNSSEFHIVIFDSGEVYQNGTEADIIGIELTSYDKLSERYRSFVGNELEELDPAWAEIDAENRNLV